jgi:hypothetical protein
MITLLNGEQWNEQDILAKMVDDSFYYGHLGQNALSSSALKKLLQSPKAYQASLRQSDSSQALRDGQLVHMSILEKHKLKDLVIIEGTKARKEYKDAVAEYGERNVFTESEVNNAYWIADAVHSNNEASYLLSDCDYEVPGVAMIEGIAHRAKADAITKDRKVIIDLKTTSSEIEDFKWSAKKFKYALQASLYLKIFGAEEFIFLVIDKNTKDIGIFTCSDMFLEYGLIDVYAGIQAYKDFFLQPNSEELIKNNVIRGIL